MTLSSPEGHLNHMTAHPHAVSPVATRRAAISTAARPACIPTSRDERQARDEALAELERQHPGLWRAGQLGQASALSVWPTGFDALAAELPGGGWPVGAVTELLHADCGMGELRLLLPALRSLTAAKRRLALIGPPHAPNAMGLAAAGLSESEIYWIRSGQPAGTRAKSPAAERTAAQADLLWAAEQVLRSQAFGGVLVWLPSVRPEAVRRLQVLAQASDAVVWAWRPATALRESSPAVLRLLLSPVPGNALSIVFHKRRGPVRDTPLVLQLEAMAAVPSGRAAAGGQPVPSNTPSNAPSNTPSNTPATPAVQAPSDSSDHAVLDRHPSAPPAAGRSATELA